MLHAILCFECSMFHGDAWRTRVGCSYNVHSVVRLIMWTVESIEGLANIVCLSSTRRESFHFVCHFSRQFAGNVGLDDIGPLQFTCIRIPSVHVKIYHFLAPINSEQMCARKQSDTNSRNFVLYCSYLSVADLLHMTNILLVLLF